jgi:hypothetical protein
MMSFFPVKFLLIAVIVLTAGPGMAQVSGKDSSRSVLGYGNKALEIATSNSFLTDPVIVADTPDIVLPFSRAGNLILIKAKADAIEGSFILDTGAPGLILNMTYFRDYPVLENAAGEGGGITGTVAGYGHIMLKKFSFGAINYHQVEADRINLGHIENTKGVKIFGLLGVQLFKQFIMIIDYENSEIHLHHISKKDGKNYKHPMLADSSQYSIFPIDILQNKILTYGKVGNKKLTFLVDTGAESNVIDSRLSENVLDNVVIRRRMVLNGTGNKKVDALYGDMSNLTIGDRDISAMPVLVTNMAKMCFAYDRCLDGMLGFDFLSMHKIGFNFVKRKMYIWK